jgi:hypothetical protein
VVLEEAWYLLTVGCVGVMERDTAFTAFLMSQVAAYHAASFIVALESSLGLDMNAKLIKESAQAFVVMLQVVDSDDRGYRSIVRLSFSFP